jgi:hypothetical protein
VKAGSRCFGSTHLGSLKKQLNVWEKQSRNGMTLCDIADLDLPAVCLLDLIVRLATAQDNVLICKYCASTVTPYVSIDKESLEKWIESDEKYVPRTLRDWLDVARYESRRPELEARTIETLWWAVSNGCDDWFVSLSALNSAIETIIMSTGMPRDEIERTVLFDLKRLFAERGQ